MQRLIARTRLLLLPLVAGVALNGCLFQKNLSQEEKDAQLQELVKEGDAFSGGNELAPAWAPVQTPYRGSDPITWDLLHTDLSVRFDWEERQLIGTAVLRLTPHFFTQDSLHLDAKGFSVSTIRFKGDARTQLAFTNDGRQLHIALGKRMAPGDTLQLVIDYIAKPYELPETGGSAITGRQGLYFINHNGKDTTKPQQIWTQGETESSSCWFPTLDQPNQRTTQRMAITVQERYTTLSNGLLVRQQPTPGRRGYRTDVWEMNQAHAPYLFMMAVGEFQVTQDEWRGKPVTYYLEDTYHPHARYIFGNTPLMLEYFSDRLGVSYPWPKYAQVVVRDFVSGAMENTTATIHGEFVQATQRELLDGHQDDIIAHELFHHWFGDLVTCESWSQITLNEGFATYGEILWREHHYGDYAADYHRNQDLQAYLGEAGGKREPLIRDHYIHRDDVFDAHSYQKGGAVLHLLRQELGDAAFFAGLQAYLTQHAGTPVEVDELRMAWEDVIGRDLQPFFDQWYHQPGHPTLNVQYVANADSSALTVYVQQTQNLNYQPVYSLPLELHVGSTGGIQKYPFRLDSLRDSITVPINKLTFQFADLDGKHVIVGEVNEYAKDHAQWLGQYRYGTNYIAQKRALSNLSIDDSLVQAALLEVGLKHPFWAMREEALDKLTSFRIEDSVITARITGLAKNDPDARVRAAAVGYLANLDVAASEELMALLNDKLADSSYTVAGTALSALYNADPELGLAKADSLSGTANGTLREDILRIYFQENDPRAVPYFMSTYPRLSNPYSKIVLMTQLGRYAATDTTEQGLVALDFLITQAREAEPWYIRLGAAQGLRSLGAEPRVQALFRERAREEPNEQLRAFYESRVAEQQADTTED